MINTETSAENVLTSLETDCVMLFSTTPDLLLAKRIAHILVEEKLAACVQLQPSLLSIYEWQGQMQGEQEVGLIIKTSQKIYKKTMNRIVQLHPYEVPEIVVLPIKDGHQPYLKWVNQQTIPK
jgi:periplasmic divalent cation tolerance protein